MNPLQRFRGTDAARLELLAARATDAAARLDLSRAAVRQAGAAGDTGSTDATLAAMQAWLQSVAGDARRRAAITAVDGSFAAGANVQGTETRGIVTTTVSDPVLREDGATGLHLQGYVGVGLAWRHIGTETRTRTTSSDFGAGWVRTETAVEHRAVFAVEVGAGYGPKRLGGLGEHTYREGWRKGHPRTAYTHDGRPVTAADFEAATGDR